MAEIRAGLANFSFRQLPPASADAQHMCGRKLEDGKRGIIREKAHKFPLNGRNKGGVGQFQLPSASVSFRRHPTHAWEEVGRREDGIIRKTTQKFPTNGRSKGGVGQIQLLPASANFRQPPRRAWPGCRNRALARKARRPPRRRPGNAVKTAQRKKPNR